MPERNGLPISGIPLRTRTDYQATQLAFIISNGKLLQVLLKALTLSPWPLPVSRAFISICLGSGVPTLYSSPPAWMPISFQRLTTMDPEAHTSYLRESISRTTTPCSLKHLNPRSNDQKLNRPGLNC